MMREAGFDLSDVWFTNCYKVRPPDNDLTRLSELGIPDSVFLDQLFEELEFYRPSIIIPVGATALGTLCPDTIEKSGAPITKYRGSILTSPRLNWPHYIISNYHPAFVLREWSVRQIAVLCYAKALDELKFFRKHGVLQPLPARSLIAATQPDEVIEYLHKSIASPDPVSIDIEMLRRRMVYTLGIALSPTSAMSFGLWEFTTEWGCRILRLTAELMRTHKLIGQNFANFDACWLSTIGVESNMLCLDDTMVRHHVLWPELEHSLQFMTVQYTREPYYKDEGHRWGPKDPKTKLKLYNAKDCAVTYEVDLEQEREFMAGDPW